MSDGFAGLGRAMEIFLNEAMRLERTAFLQAWPHGRSEDRRGYANGFRDKRLKSKLSDSNSECPAYEGFRMAMRASTPRPWSVACAARRP